MGITIVEIGQKKGNINVKTLEGMEAAEHIQSNVVISVNSILEGKTHDELGNKIALDGCIIPEEVDPHALPEHTEVME